MRSLLRALKALFTEAIERAFGREVLDDVVASGSGVKLDTVVPGKGSSATADLKSPVALSLFKQLKSKGVGPSAPAGITIPASPAETAEVCNWFM